MNTQTYTGDNCAEQTAHKWRGRVGLEKSAQDLWITSMSISSLWYYVTALRKVTITGNWGECIGDSVFVFSLQLHMNLQLLQWNSNFKKSWNHRVRKLFFSQFLFGLRCFTLFKVEEQTSVQMPRPENPATFNNTLLYLTVFSCLFNVDGVT